MDVRVEIMANILVHEPMANVFVVAQSHAIFRPVHVLADNSLPRPVVLSRLLGRDTPSLKGRRQMLSRLRHHCRANFFSQEEGKGQV